MAEVYVSIGSNLGDREKNCLSALEHLDQEGLHIITKSSLHETEPWGHKEQPAFINMAARAETDLPPKELLAVVRKIEQKMGREPAFRWGPRLIDIDILFYGDIILNEEDLVIPHPLMHERLFVLEPLAEIAPEKIHPVLKRSVKELLEDARTR